MSPRVPGASQPLTFGLSPPPTAATFMEHWKRKQMRLNYRWDLTGFEEEEVSGFGAAPPVLAPHSAPRPGPSPPGDAHTSPRSCSPGETSQFTSLVFDSPVVARATVCRLLDRF